MQVKKVDEEGRPYIQIDEKHIIRLELEEIEEAYKEKAEQELRETEENIEKGLAGLRKLLKGDEELYVPYEIDDFLIKFLRPVKYFPENAYELMQRYYKFKLKYPKYCENLTPATAELGFIHNVIKFQPVRDQHGRRILVLEGGKRWNPKEVPLLDLFRAIQLSLEAAMLEPMTQVNGTVTIIDMESLSLQHIMVFTPSFACMLLEWLQECIPLRLKAVHIVNNSYLFNMLFAIFKPFISQKLRHRIFFHGKDYKSLHKHIDPDRLRPCFGGTLKCEEVDGKLVAQLLGECTEEFEMANLFGYVGNNNRVIIPEKFIAKYSRKKQKAAAS